MSEELKKRLAAIEVEMGTPAFWSDKIHAQALVKEYQELKEELETGGAGGKYDRGNAILSIFSGAGGDDAEDFSRILFEMYQKYVESKGWQWSIVHAHENDHGGYRNLTIRIEGRNVYGTLKNESGVHRLVRVSPYSAKKLRHTSFSMVEVIPEFPKGKQIEIPEDDIKVEFARSSGPGGQNVNKRETAVRVVHIPTNLAVHCEAERSQADNKARALEMLAGKLYKLEEEARVAKEKGMYISKTTANEWGSQIRSYVFHPYQLIKDHRTGVEEKNVDKVLYGDLDEFIEAEKSIS
ncbi:MAG: peptide chain release factor 2 [Candidatus Vogelbacteria bacterium CG10_big_fil_rev_8_21_14_0_10_51_16]|uniref:Peptide chain release factor 2 n=1 Tax=Candidatus Vogelbacteria bacterium CG10_big_fil_rev_8_21_14_0_10_51_16 TaxID=1975045 RepID=A0A2H0RDX4_9BACT|nr:MAG: peptide chain release factor 2 [Candidatus Vogelbacteria bacterium CG10_big_fil_rev_8_21_14_0_10_51_16]